MDFNQYLKDRPRSCTRGAPMGNSDSRHAVVEDNQRPYEFDIQELQFEDYDYTLDGTYWGWSDKEKLFLAMTDDTETWMYVRAITVAFVKEKVLERFPNSTFKE